MIGRLQWDRVTFFLILDTVGGGGKKKDLRRGIGKGTVSGRNWDLSDSAVQGLSYQKKESRSGFGTKPEGVKNHTDRRKKGKRRSKTGIGATNQTPKSKTARESDP